MNNTQKVNIRLLNAKYTNTMIRGDMAIAAIPVMPELMKEYILSKNRRKSNNTLPPFSPAYWDSLLLWTFAI